MVVIKTEYSRYSVSVEVLQSQHRQSSPKGTLLKLGWNRGGVLKTCNISETGQDRTKVTIDDDLGLTLTGHYAFCFKIRASFRAHHENLNEDKTTQVTTM